MGGRQSRRCRASRWLPWVASLLALAVAPAASARVALVATGTPEAVFIGIPRNEVVARLALPGPSRAVAVSRDGNRGYVSAGSEIVALDVNHRSETGRSNWGAGQPEIIDLELARSGDVLYAVRGSQLLALDPLTLGQRAVVELGAVARQLAVAPDGATAAVALRGGRVAMLSLRGGRLLRHVALQGAVGVAISDSGMTYVTARRRLRLIAAGQRRARKRAIALPAGAGGWLALSPGRSKLVVGAAPRGRAAALVELERLKVRRLVSGTGPGRAAWDPTASRIALADAGSGSVSLVSPFTRGRVLLIPLPGTTPTDVVVQPGLALIMGSDLADRITGSRGDDEIRGLEGDDVLRGGRGRDVLEGGPGADQLSGGANSDRATGDEGDDFLVGGNGDDKLFGGPGSDGADGGTGNDTIHGDDGDDTLDGGDGDDTILGGEGDDTIVEKGFGDDKLLDGGPGNDLIKGGRGSDQVIRGGPGERPAVRRDRLGAHPRRRRRRLHRRRPRRRPARGRRRQRHDPRRRRQRPPLRRPRRRQARRGVRRRRARRPRGRRPADRRKRSRRDPRRPGQRHDPRRRRQHRHDRLRRGRRHRLRRDRRSRRATC